MKEVERCAFPPLVLVLLSRSCCLPPSLPCILDTFQSFRPIRGRELTQPSDRPSVGNAIWPLFCPGIAGGVQGSALPSTCHIASSTSSSCRSLKARVPPTFASSSAIDEGELTGRVRVLDSRAADRADSCIVLQQGRVLS